MMVLQAIGEPDVDVDDALSISLPAERCHLFDSDGKALTKLNLIIKAARIATFGERAVDVFYVQDALGGKIDNKVRLRNIERKLIAALEEGDCTAARKPAKTASKTPAKTPGKTAGKAAKATPKRLPKAAAKAAPKAARAGAKSARGAR